MKDLTRKVVLYNLARNFPGQTQPNPKGRANAIILQSETELSGPTEPKIENPAMYQKHGEETEKEAELKEVEKEGDEEAV